MPASREVPFIHPDPLSGSCNQPMEGAPSSPSGPATMEQAGLWSRLCALWKGGRVPVIIMVAVFALAHSLRLLSGADSCQVMLGQAVMQAGPLSPGPGHWWGDEWHPTGCLMQQYAGKKSHQLLGECLAQKHIAFVGDSRARQVFQATVKMLEPTADVGALADYHSDAEFSAGAASLSFRWRPELAAKETLSYYRSLADGVSGVEKPPSIPDVIVHTAGLWALKRQDGTAKLGQDVTQLAAALSRVASSGRLVYVLPIGPVDESLLREDRKAITNDAIAVVNQMLRDAFAGDPTSSVVVVESIVDLLQQATAAGRATDGLHYDDPTQGAQSSLLLNAVCHRDFGLRPKSTTCCVGPTPLEPQQYVGIGALLVCFVYTLMRKARSKSDTEVKATRWEGIAEQFSRVFLLMAYLFVCDRTSLFMKEAKEFSPLWFAVPLLVLLLLGVGTMTESKGSTFLNRDQTNEWKGWMQLLFLVYHYTMASAVLPIYVFIRVCVAAFLFMTGYGHFSYFYIKANYGWRRVAQVMLRLNIFVIVLCLVMGGGYQAYYFVPLCSFWFLTVYAAMAPFRGLHDSNGALAARFALYFSVCTLLWLPFSSDSYPVFHAVFGLPGLRDLFSVDGSLQEWRFRSGLDRYVTGFGMLIACVYLARKDWFQPAAGWAAGLFGLTMFASYAWFATTCPNKPVCNATHGYFSLALILGYVLLRNATPWLRNHHSQFFAATGTISLELFLGQYHIFLAQDTRASLVFLPGWPVVNSCLTTMAFAYVSAGLSDAFNALVPLVIPAAPPAVGLPGNARGSSRPVVGRATAPASP